MMLPARPSHTLAAVRPRPRDTVLLHGAGGGAGASVLQLAGLDDIRVIGTGAEKDFATIRAHWGTPVSYGEGLADRVAALTEITKSGDADLGSAKGQRRARRGIEHPRRYNDPCAMLVLDEDDISPMPPLGVKSPDWTAIEGVSSIVDGHLRFDPGRIAPQ